MIDGDNQPGGILERGDGARAGDGGEAAPLTAKHGPDLPVFRPSLPTAEEVLPYLKRIDASHWYSNHGPLNREFESRLATLFGVPENCVLTSCNGTAALVQALRGAAACASRRPGPSWRRRRPSWRPV